RNSRRTASRATAAFFFLAPFKRPHRNVAASGFLGSKPGFPSSSLPTRAPSTDGLLATPSATWAVGKTFCIVSTRTCAYLLSFCRLVLPGMSGGSSGLLPLLLEEIRSSQFLTVRRIRSRLVRRPPFRRRP